MRTPTKITARAPRYWPRSRSIASDNQSVTNDYLAEGGRESFELLTDTGHPGLKAWRRFRNPFHHFRLSAIKRAWRCRVRAYTTTAILANKNRPSNSNERPIASKSSNLLLLYDAANITRPLSTLLESPPFIRSAAPQWDLLETRAAQESHTL
jgi:hypothetical protein